jgi:hypothetical protein
MAKQTKTPGAAAAPQSSVPATIDWNQYAGATGLENVRQEDLGLPFLMILQSGSPELKKTDPKFIVGAGVGDIINTLTREVVHKEGGDPLIFVPCAYDFIYMEWKPREEGGGLVKSHRDARILEEATRNEKDSRDYLRNGNVIVPTAYYFGQRLTGTEPERCVIGFSSTQLKKSRHWLNLAMSNKMNGRPLPLFSMKYALSSIHEENNKGDWYGWKIEKREPNVDRDLVTSSADIAQKSLAMVNKLLTQPATPVDAPDPGGTY